jgi:hypothetical protein
MNVDFLWLIEHSQLYKKALHMTQQPTNKQLLLKANFEN